MATDQALAIRQGHEAQEQQSYEVSLASHDPLWLCVYFPNLALEVFISGVEHIGPMAVVQEERGRCVLRAVSRAAEEEGISAGMPLNAAYALCRGLDTRLYDPKTEARRLVRLAVWAGQFTPTVSLMPPQALLLEVRASLKLFGGLDHLCNLIGKGLTALGNEWVIAVAPTPMASWFMARNGDETVVTDKDALRSVLGRLPLTGLGLDSSVVMGLHRSGLHTLRDVWRLPREGLTHRFGCEVLNTLDRALGVAPDPRETFIPPERFVSELELPFEVWDTELLLLAAHRLLLELSGFLRARDAAVSHLKLNLHHRRRSVSALRIGVRRGTRDAAHLLLLIKERLERVRVPAPVIRLALRADEIQPFMPNNRHMFEASDNTSQDWNQVLERLQARLGESAVQGLQPMTDHRPERAWTHSELGKVAQINTRAHRPMWLLPEPQALTVRRGSLWRHGVLRIQQGPERIEGGWWNDMDIRRDYYIATDRDGSRLWVFRDLYQGGRWYIHGLFG